jgi:chromopyrrolic acid synthase
MSVFDFPRLHFAGVAIRRLPTGPRESVVDLGTGRVVEVREGANFGGNGHFLIDATVVGVDVAEDDLDRADPVVGRAVDMWGHHNEYLGTTVNRARIFDVDPASRFSTTVMVGQFGFGRAGRSHDTGYMVTGQVSGFQPPRWQRPGQVVHQFVVDKADGLNWLPETDRSAATTALRSMVAHGDADGLVVQFVLDSTGGIRGTIAPWSLHELRTYPAGRLLTSCAGNASNLTVDVGGSGVQLNLVEPLPAGCRLQIAHSHEVVALVPADRVGIVRADLRGSREQAAVEALEVVDGTGAVVLAEQEINVQVDDACVILEHPAGEDDHDHDVEVRVRSYVRGVPASVPAIHVRQFPNPAALPREKGDFVIVGIDEGAAGVVSTDETGLGAFTVRGLRPGTARLSLTVDEADTPDDHDDERRFARVGAMTVRVLPDDWRLDAVPDEEVTFDLVYHEVLEPYEQLYSFMRDEVFSLADRFKVQTYAKLIWQMCDPRNKGRTYYMPPSRDLTAPKARLLLRFLRQQQRPAQVTRILPSSDRDRTGITTREALVTALGHAAVVELGVMLQYLYAAYSVPTHGAGLEYVRLGLWNDQQLAVACGDGGESLDTGIRTTLLSIAREEMMHFLMVNNVLMAIGEPFTVPRIDFGTINDELPIALEFSLEGLGLGSVQRFIEIEKPESAVGDVHLGDVRATGPRPPFSYASLSELYGDIRDGLRRVPGLFVVEKGRGGGEHHLFLRRSIDMDHPDYQMEVDDLPSALFAIDVITEQGEGNVLTSERPDEESHHAAFTRLAGLLAEDPAWRPSYPVLRNPTLHDGSRIKDQVTLPDTRAAMQLFNESYFMMLQLMVQHFGGQPDSSLRRSVLMNHAIDVMTGMMRPLAELIVTMPSGRRGRTAGPSFELPGQPGYISRPDVASRTIARRFQRIAEEAAKHPLVPARVSEQSQFLCDYFWADSQGRRTK